MTRRHIRWAFGMAFLFVALREPCGAQDSLQVVMRKRTAAEDLQLFSQVLNQIRVNHPDSIDTHDLFMAAIEGMVRAADPHSYVIPARRVTPALEKDLFDGKLRLVPISFSFIGGSAVVSSVSPGTAASRLDVLPGDELIAIEGKPIQAESEVELELALAGQKGSSVKLTFIRRRSDGSLAELERTIEREQPGHASAIPAAFLLSDSVGYVRVATFVGEKIASDLSDAMRALEKQGMRQLILDLRDNGGGSVDEAARVAGAFLPAGTVVYTSEGRKPGIAKTGKVQRAFWKSEKQFPIIVMINNGTASASELVAGALQDHDRALIAGRPSFGKSLLMQTMPLADGSLMALVVGHVKTPCGRIVQRQYRHVRIRDYYRLAGAERDLAGRPSCKTDNGRIVYGGGGIYPDVLLPARQPTPLWLARTLELGLPLRWAGGFLTAQGDAVRSADDLAKHPSLDAAALADFRAYAARDGITIPTDSDSDARLDRVLVLHVARAKWGDEGFTRVSAALDPDVAAVQKEFARAASIMLPKQP